MKLAVIILLIVLVLLLAAGWFMAGYTMSIPRQTLEQARQWQQDHYDIDWYDALEKQDYTVSGFEGYELHVQCLVNRSGSGKYVILSHGYTDNRYGSLKYAQIYLKQGYQVILYDLRGHGENEPTFCTYSVREGRDLDALIRDTRTRYDDLTLLGIHGESLGAATSVACLQYHPEIDFVVADCGFASIADVLKNGAKSAHVPGWMIDLAGMVAKLRFGYGYAEMCPVNALAGNQIPILFLHGEQDTFILPEHSRRMERATAGVHELHLIPGAGHAESVLTDPEGYEAYVTAFLEKVTG